jgi:hypothetical protein
MLNRFKPLIIVLVATSVVSLAALAHSNRLRQATPLKDQKSRTAKGQKVDPAMPRHDLSGTWEPANGPSAAIQPDGVMAIPNDGKPEHQLPYTPYGLQAYKSHHATSGADQVLPGFDNDPRNKCEPLGFPRMNFYNLRETQILQNEYKIVMLYEYETAWRVIWVDGRELPNLVDGGVLIGNEVKDPRYYGYSVGKWVDDTTLVVQTIGMIGEDRLWLDITGRPISDQLRVEERFNRVDHDHLEWTVTIDDPKMYSRPWVAMDKFPMKLEDPHRDVPEQYCSPTEIENYNKVFGNPASVQAGDAPER